MTSRGGGPEQAAVTQHGHCVHLMQCHVQAVQLGQREAKERGSGSLRLTLCLVDLLLGLCLRQLLFSLPLLFLTLKNTANGRGHRDRTPAFQGETQIRRGATQPPGVSEVCLHGVPLPINFCPPALVSLLWKGPTLSLHFRLAFSISLP